MSDRTPSSVRTGSVVGDAAPQAEDAPAGPPPASATQSIPTTGSLRAQPGPAAPAAGATPAGSAGSVAPARGPAPAAPAAAAPAPGAPARGAAAAAPAAAAPAPGAPAAGATPAGPPPASATQSIPTTGSLRAQPGPAAPATGAPLAETVVPQAGRPPVDPAVSEGSRGSRVRGVGKGRGPRRARLQLRHIDTWSALKISFVLSVALFFIWMVAVGVLYGVLSALGVFGTLNDLFGQLGTASGAEGGGSEVVTPGLVFGVAAVVGAINIVLLTALCTVGAFIYNLCSDLVGGLEVTLSERD